MKKKFLFLSLIPLSLFSLEEESKHIAFLARTGQTEKALSAYIQIKEKNHDFQLLETLAIGIIENGTKSKNPQEQIASLYATSLAGLSSSINLLETLIKSRDPYVQLATIQLIGRLQDDRADKILNRAMASDFLEIRLEAGLQLCSRKTKNALPRMEALMGQVPQEFHFYFPEFFALIGSDEALAKLKSTISSPLLAVRIESILAAVKYGQETTLSLIQKRAQSTHPAEQEAVAFALSTMQDQTAKETLTAYLNSHYDEVRLSAFLGLYHLGSRNLKEEVFSMAIKDNLFAINALKTFPESEYLLTEKLLSENIEVRINAAIALLELKNAKGLPILVDFFLDNSRGLYPHLSPGKSLVHYNVIATPKGTKKTFARDTRLFCLAIKEELLEKSFELEEGVFLNLVHKIIEKNQKALIPKVMELLERNPSEKALTLLKKSADHAGSPFLRTWASLTLFRLKEAGYKERVAAFLRERPDALLIQFRDPELDIANKGTHRKPFLLAPEEESALILKSYLSLADTGEKSAVDLLLELMQKGNMVNRYALGGILLCAIK